MPAARVCASCLRAAAQKRSYGATTALRSSESSRLPRIANPSFWASLVPSFLRRPATAEQAAQRAKVKDAASEERRTGLIFLFLGVLVGSNAINLISIRRDMLNFTRQTEAKLALLREIVQKVKNGQDIDVQAALGSGDADQEKEWEQMIKELENTDMLSEGRRRRDAKRAKQANERRIKEAEQSRERQGAETEPTAAASSEGQKSRPKFLM